MKIPICSDCIAENIDCRSKNGDSSCRNFHNAMEEKFTSTNTGSPKLLDDMERFAVMCDRAGNGKDARCVRSWVKQLRAGA